MFEILGEALGYISVIIAVIIIILGIVYKLTGSKKVLKIKEFLESLNVNTIYYMEKVEEIEGMKGPEKKRWVMNRMDKLAEENNVEIDSFLIDQMIERFIEFSKNVNAK